MRSLACIVFLLLPTGLFGLSFSVEVGGSFSMLRPHSVGQFDRSAWSTFAGVHFPVLESITLGAEYGFGGLLYGSSGHGFTHGPSVHIRGEVHKYVYAGAGASMTWAGAFRENPIYSVTTSMGIPLQIFDNTIMNNELYCGFRFAEASAFFVGLRNSMSVTW